jgi:DNA invertase Pin-like site-specific DNA recombinase
METVIYARVSSNSQDGNRQKTNLQAIAQENGWVVNRVFSEKISGNVRSDDRKEFKNLLGYVKEKKVKLVMISEISRLGRRVVDVLTTIDQLHSNGVALYVQQFNMISLEEGRENPMVKMLIQMLAMGAEMENSLRKERQLQGIALAKLEGKYIGRKEGAKTSEQYLVTKYKDVVDLIRNSELPLRRISSITKRSINTVRKLKGVVQKESV